MLCDFSDIGCEWCCHNNRERTKLQEYYNHLLDNHPEAFDLLRYTYERLEQLDNPVEENDVMEYEELVELDDEGEYEFPGFDDLYDREIILFAEENITCAICCDKTAGIEMNCCHQKICTECLTKCFETKRRLTCPFCRNRWKRDYE